MSLPDWPDWAWWTIYFGVWAISALLYGYCSGAAKDIKGKETIHAEAVLFGAWPIGAIFLVVLSPLWVPVALAEIGAWFNEKEEKKEAVERALEFAHMVKEKCDNCGRPKHEGDCDESK